MSRHRARRVFYFRDWRAAIDRKSSRILIGWSSQLEIANSPHLAETGRLQRLNHHRVAQQCQFNFQHLSLCQYAILRYHFVTLALLATWGVQAIVKEVTLVKHITDEAPANDITIDPDKKCKSSCYTSVTEFKKCAIVLIINMRLHLKLYLCPCLLRQQSAPATTISKPSAMILGRNVTSSST